MNKNFRTACLVTVLILCPEFLWAVDKTSGEPTGQAKAVIKEVSVQDVKKMIDAGKKAIILDVRMKEEFLDGHVPGAVNMAGMDDLSREQAAREVSAIIRDRKAVVVVYCTYGKHSPSAVKLLQDLGFNNAVNMQGGFEAWENTGYPVERQK